MIILVILILILILSFLITEEFSKSAADRASDEIAATQAQTTESTPTVRDDIVRSEDAVEEEKSVPGGPNQS
ncbi:hypothetical protein BSL78_09024 [Apostichopus japonicus]|uniref:Secreted protein n=1 Tax=Stichopus japonicus TaxID=307972 RepID=A0A2G8L1G4_STIJA|nr:hypothetical protein BSL78_09024 [Apostichopus japonicus]